VDGRLRARQGGEAMLVADVKLGNVKGTLNTLLGDWIS